MRVALVGASPVLAALQKLLGADCALLAERTTADHVAQAVGPEGAVVLDLPAGESREFARALGARNIRVLDLGPDLRVPQVSCAFLGASGKRVAAMPSPDAMAAFVAAAPLLDKGVMHAGRLVVLARWPHAAEELGWMLEQTGRPPTRRIGVPAPVTTAWVIGEIGNQTAPDAHAGFAWARLCPPGVAPDPARVLGTGVAEVSVAADEFAEFVVAGCVLDPVPFTAHAALRALQQMAD